MGKRALIAMSGGVDSSVAAYLMLREGVSCTSVTVWQREGFDGDMEEAARAACQLGISHVVLDWRQTFRQEVIEPFVQVYESGATPNPCLICNQRMRAGHLLHYALENGFDFVVTGHYARILYDESLGRYLLKRGLDKGKDQSYVHYAMTQRQLAHMRFPLGAWHKDEVRSLAGKLGFANSNKQDSQDICFIPDGDYGTFLEQYTGKSYPSGDFLDLDGRVIGEHRGAVRYTIGQRRGLGLPMGSRVYVCGKNMEHNTVTVGPEHALFSSALIAGEVNWIPFDVLTVPRSVTVQTRYRQKDHPAVVFPLNDGTVRVEFETPQRAVTPGQAAVFYDGNTVLGGGTILQAVP